MTAIALPTVRSEIDKRWTSQKFLIIGSPGVGKSSFFSTADKTLYIQTEAGLNHLSVMKIPCRSWEDFKGIYTALIQSKNEGKLPYQTIIVDTLDKWIDLAHQEIIERGKNKFKNIDINVIGDIPNGAGWAWATDLIENALDKLCDLNCAIVLIGHLETKEVKEPTRSIHKQTVSVGGKMGGMICAWADQILNIESTNVSGETKRKIRTNPTSTIEAKSRGGIVPDSWVWTINPKENYEKLKSLFQ